MRDETEKCLSLQISHGTVSIHLSPKAENGRKEGWQPFFFFFFETEWSRSEKGVSFLIPFEAEKALKGIISKWC